MIQLAYWLATEDESQDQVLATAAQELCAYARRLTGKAPRRKRTDQLVWTRGTALLGLVPTVAPPARCQLAPSPWDDGYAIWSERGQLRIAGRNARSVLFGVYDFLERQGCEFLRPGPGGEVVPRRRSLALPARPIVERAALRHRGLCIEGALSREHCLATVAWAARRRLNTIFLQFQTSQFFYNNYYGRAHRGEGEPASLSPEQAAAIDNELIAEAHRRGLIIHRVGHGWTSTAFGMTVSGWVKSEEIPEETRRYTALINGQRGIFKRVPINTELCYSHPPAFAAMVEAVVAYAEAHPEVDVIHVWLSDADSNKCECDDCRRLTISDWYVRLISAISAELHRRAPSTRVVFLSYIELWWPPESERFTGDSSNVIFMYAPICRRYDEPLHAQDGTRLRRYPRPALNQMRFYHENAFYRWSLAQWKKVFPGDSFDFDYHLMWVNWHQLLDTPLAEILHNDMAGLEALGLNGLISCQSWRASYPTGLAQWVMGEALWNPRCAWSTRWKRFFGAAYGDHAAWVTRYVRRLATLLPRIASQRETPVLRQMDTQSRRKLQMHLADGERELRVRRRREVSRPVRYSLDLLLHHARLLLLLLQAVERAEAGDAQAAESHFSSARRFVETTEARVGYSVDTGLLTHFYINMTERAYGATSPAGD